MYTSRLLPFFAIIVFASCAKVKEPEFRKVEQFKIRSLGITEVRIGFNVTYFNPNRFGVTVKEAAASLYIDSVYVGKFSQDAAVLVGRNADFSIPMTGAIPLQTALQINLQGIGERQISIRADGEVKVGKAGIFSVRPFHYEGKHSLSEIRL